MPRRKYVLGPDVDLDQEVVLDKSGRRVTEADAERIAEETLQALGRGRPSLTGPGEHSPEIKARVPSALRERLREVAAQQGKSPSQVIREALERHLADHGR